MKIFDQFFYHHDKSNSESKSRNTWLRVFNSTSNRHLCINTENGRPNLTRMEKEIEHSSDSHTRVSKETVEWQTRVVLIEE